MQEFSSVTASSYDAESLAPMLTEKASEGWEVVSIVSAGTNVVAYLQRATVGASTATGGDDDTAASAEPAATDGAIATATADAAATGGWADDTATDETATDDTADDESAGDDEPSVGAVAAGVAGVAAAGAAVGAAADPTPVAESAPEVDPVLAGSVAAEATEIAPSLPGESPSVSVPETVDTAANEAAAAAAAAVDEPAGWGADPAPADTPAADTSVMDLAEQVGAADQVEAAADAAGGAFTDATSAADAAGAVVTADAADTVLAGTESTAETAVADTAAAAETVVVDTGAAAETAVADSGVPAGWYADPSGRFELRYWDGNAWTEHVSRAGQQYTDPPVA